MSKMSHRERVKMALSHREPDRVPVDLMGNASMLLDETYHNLREHLGLSPIPPVRYGTTANYYDDRVLEWLDVDFRRVFLSKPHRHDTRPNGAYTDEWGVRHVQSGPYWMAVGHPLEEADSLSAIEGYHWPRAHEVFDPSGLREAARTLYEQTDCALVARNPLTTGFMDRGCMLAGTEGFLTMLIEEPGMAHALIERILEYALDVYAILLDACGDFVQMVETADDLGTQDAPLISPAMYRTFFKPADRALNELIRKKAPSAKVFRHCDGAIFELIPDLIDAGVDVLNPVQTSARGMDAARLKRTFGADLCFHGALERVGCNAVQDEEQMRKLFQSLAPGGGYIASTCNSLMSGEPENIVKLFESIRETGRYPQPGGIV